MKSLIHGFYRVAAASIPLRLASPGENADLIISAIQKALGEGVRLLVLPELCLTGASSGDLFFHDPLLEGAKKALGKVLEATKGEDIITVLGLPVRLGASLFNAAAVIQRGKILGLALRSFPALGAEGGLARWFSPGSAAGEDWIELAGCRAPLGEDLLFQAREEPRLIFGIQFAGDLRAPIPPSAGLAQAGALFFCCPAAEGERVGGQARRRALLQEQSRRLVAGYIYAGAGVGESTTDAVYGGASLIAENGRILEEGGLFSRGGTMIVRDLDLDLLEYRRRKPAFTAPGAPFGQEEPQGLDARRTRGGKFYRRIPFTLPSSPLEGLRRELDPHPFVPSPGEGRDQRCREVFALQTAGLAGRLEHIRSKKLVLGVSGGLDSTQALLVAVKTFDLLGLDRRGILGITMPGFGTSERTYANSRELMRVLGISSRDIDIRPACLQHFADIGHDPEVHDTTYENVQARERTQILMDLANKTGGLVLGSGDLSELALGWCTYGGDQISMYGINAGVPKTLMGHLIAWVAEQEGDGEVREVLQAILDTPISPELLPPGSSGEIAQKTEEILGPYEVHDFFLYHFLRNGASPAKLLFLARQAFADTQDGKNLRSWLEVFLRRFFSQQFKRSCMPDGPQIGSVNLSPRGALVMPSDANAEAWLLELE